jgi:hypothetical protein
MFARVVKSFPATRSMVSRPRAASRRNPDAAIEPSGKASNAATESRKGVVLVIDVCGGRIAFIFNGPEAGV